jgi:hypothetical protein
MVGLAILRQTFEVAQLWLKCRPICLPTVTDEP